MENPDLLPLKGIGISHCHVCQLAVILPPSLHHLGSQNIWFLFQLPYAITYSLTAAALGG